MNLKKYFLTFILFIWGVLRLQPAVKLPSVFSDNMVLQQNTLVNIWGMADYGEIISIETSWEKKNHLTIAETDGKWTLKIKTPKASSAEHWLKITGNGDTIEIKKILIGEVWLCSGQSNMDFPISKAHTWRTGIIGEEEEMQDADYPEIRLFHVEQNISPEQELGDCNGRWVICNRENLKTFSAIAFFFGREIYNNVRFPVGLIQSTWGGTPAEAWTKMDVIQSDPVYAPLIAEYERVRENYSEELKKYEAEKSGYDKIMEEAKERGDRINLKVPKKPEGIYNNKALATLWNAMIHPLIPYTLKGVIWYQGESNSGRANDYTHVFSNLIKSWRKEWGQGNFPFYFVQIAPHYKQPPQLREAQLKTWNNVPNTGMVVITDAGDSTDIHPRNKKIPGIRLALWALANDYNKKVSYSGPVYKSIKIKGNIAVLDFDYKTEGLVSEQGPLKGFVIAGNDRIFYPATATIKKNKIELFSPEVPEPVAVRYGWDKFFRANLYNGAGLPATPFRTDDWTDN